VLRTARGTSSEVAADGWFVAGSDGKPGRVYFTDGASIPAPPEKEMKKVDFKAVCKARYAPAPKKKGDASAPDADRPVKRGDVLDDDLEMAAWLYRLGDEETAALALAAAHTRHPDPRAKLRGQLAYVAYAGLVHAFIVRADEEALAHGERILKQYTDEAMAERGYPGAARMIVEDLRRRQKKGTFGKEPAKDWPEEFAKWDTKKKTAYLIDQLDEVDTRQRGTAPGRVDLSTDRRVRELIRLGDSAVPALIDALKCDERLTRSAFFWDDFSPHRAVIGVRTAVDTALQSILRVREIVPTPTEDTTTARDEDWAQEKAKQLRAYWAEYGKLPFDERMMKILTNPKTTFEAKREAAKRLADLTADLRRGTVVWTCFVSTGAGWKLNSMIAKFSKPTVAEAVLTTMDADLKTLDAEPSKDDPYGRDNRPAIEGLYLSVLVELGDERIVPELAKRAADATALRVRQRWAWAAHHLGDPKPFRAFADDFRTGKLPFPDGHGAGVELGDVVRALVDVETPEADAALTALANPKHPQHKIAAEQVLTPSSGWSEARAWFAHPFCLTILRAALDDRTPTGAKYTIKNDTLSHHAPNVVSSGGVPPFLRDPGARRDEAEERVCDDAAIRLQGLVIGLPLYHPMFRDSEARLVELKVAFDRFAGKYRRPTWREAHALGLSSDGPAYVPDIKPLDRAATLAEVKSGRAIFHLDGKGRPAELKPPAVGVLKRDAKKPDAPQVLIVQAEVGPDGKLTYGIITRNEVRTAAADELTDIKTFAQWEKEQEEAKKAQKKKE
jgi:hypothetical protein